MAYLMGIFLRVPQDQMPSKAAVSPRDARELEGTSKSSPGTHDELDSSPTVDQRYGGQSADVAASDSSDRNIPVEPKRS